MRSSDRLGRCTTAPGDFTFLAGAACDIHDAGREKPCLQHVRVLYRSHTPRSCGWIATAWVAFLSRDPLGTLSFPTDKVEGR